MDNIKGKVIESHTAQAFDIYTGELMLQGGLE